MKRILYKLVPKQYAHGIKNVGYLAIANLITKIVTLFAFVYIPNRLGLTLYGKYSIILTFVNLFTIIGFNGINKVIIREASIKGERFDEFIHNVFNLKFLLALIQVFITIIIGLAINKYDTSTKILIAITSLGSISRGLITIPTSLLQAEEKIKMLALIQTTQNLLRTIGIVFIVYITNNLYIVIIYRVIISFIFVYIYYIQYEKYSNIKFKFNFRKIGLPPKKIKEAINFSLLGVLGILSLKIDVFMLSILGTEKEVGLYSLAEKIIVQFEPLRGMILTSFFPIFIKRFKSGQVKQKKINQLGLIIFFITIMISTIISFIIGPLLVKLYKPEYQRSINILFVLSYYLVFFFSSLPFSTSIQSVGLEKYILRVYPIIVIANICFNYFLYKSLGIVGFAYSTLIVQFILFASNVLIFNILLKKKGYIK